jgi:hypothetical protein
MLTRLTGLYGTDAVWPHHLVVFVLYDVAVPDELARRVELRPHACDLAGIGDDGVLETVLPRLGRGYIAVKLNRFHNLTVIIQDQTLAVHHFKYDLVNVHRVRITCWYDPELHHLTGRIGVGEWRDEQGNQLTIKKGTKRRRWSPFSQRSWAWRNDTLAGATINQVEGENSSILA